MDRSIEHSDRRTDDVRTDPTTRPDDPDQIKAEIDATREQLGRTVDELSARLDVPARAKESALRARDTAVETYRESPPLVIGGALALVGLVVGLVVLVGARIGGGSGEQPGRTEQGEGARERSSPTGRSA